MGEGNATVALAIARHDLGDWEEATRLYRRSGELARLSDESAAQLRQNVTSPKGTTLEALNVLMAPDGLQPLMTKAIAAATRRSRELAQ